MKKKPIELQNSYDRVAEDYAKQFGDELTKKPFDCRMLNRLVENVGKQETICDLGCGSGHIASYLSRRGAKVCGIDLSPEMVKQARRLIPKFRFGREICLI